MSPIQKLIGKWVRTGSNPAGALGSPKYILGTSMACNVLRSNSGFPLVMPLIYSPYDSRGNSAVESAHRVEEDVSEEVIKFYSIANSLGVRHIKLARSPEELREELIKTRGVERVIVSNSYMAFPNNPKFDYPVSRLIEEEIYPDFKFNKKTGLYLIHFGCEVNPIHLRQLLRAEKPAFFKETKHHEFSGFKQVHEWE